MQLDKNFIAGFASAINSLGSEGDQRGVDWSEAYNYLKSRLDTFEPTKPVKILGLNIFISNAVAPGTIEFHHADGRVDSFQLDGAGQGPSK